MGQQLVYRAVGVLGLFLFGTAAGLSPLLGWLFAAMISLGAAVIGPAVLIVEFEPVPRGFALPFVIFSLAMIGRKRWIFAALSATVAFAFHPPTALAWCGVLLVIFAIKRHWRALGSLAVGPAVLGLSVLLQAPPPESAPLLARLGPDAESLLRMRAAYNWVSIWIGKYFPLYVGEAAVWLIAWLRVRRNFNRETNLLLTALPVIGILSVPLSYLLLEKMKWTLVPQFQPGRYLLFVTLFAMMLAILAAIKASQSKSYPEAVLFFFACLSVSAMEWDPATLLGPRTLVAFGLALLASVAASRANPALVAVAALAPFVCLPYLGRVQNYAAVHTSDLNQLARWARENTGREAIFQFGDTARRLEPGIFRVRAKRALYVDWKAGGQVNFLPSFAGIWAKRWADLAQLQPISKYRDRDIDYLVLQKSNRQAQMASVFENSQWVVYDLRNASTSARDGIDACAPTRVTESAAAAFANRRESGNGCPSVSATASPALNVSPAAVVSLASTRNPGE